MFASAKEKLGDLRMFKFCAISNGNSWQLILQDLDICSSVVLVAGCNPPENVNGPCINCPIIKLLKQLK